MTSSDLSVDFLRHGYELRSKIGSGSMGNVYLVFSQKYNLLFASKQILKRRHTQNDEECIPLSSSKPKKANFQTDSEITPVKIISSEDQFSIKKVHIDPNAISLQSKIRSSASSDIANIQKTSDIERILKSDEDIIAEESKNEIESLMLLNHPNVVKMYEVFEEGDYIYMILEYCQNNSLKDFVNTKPGKRLEGKELFNCVLQMTLALQYCHSMKIAHRDLKPANFLLDQYYRLKLADFGLSMSNKQDISNDEVKVCGSPAYMSPELLRYRKSNNITKSSNNFNLNQNDKDETFFTGNIDLYKADIWALGINIYEVASGTKPFVGTIDQIRKQVMHAFEKPQEIEDPSLIKLLRGILKINPSARYTIDQILSSEYFINNGYSDTQNAAGLSYLIQPLKSSILSSQPASISPALPNTQSFLSHNSNRNRTRCLASTSSFLNKRPTKLTSKKATTSMNFNVIKPSSQQSIITPTQQAIITPKKRISPALQLLKSNAAACQDSFNMYGQFSDDQKDPIVNVPHLPTLKEEPEFNASNNRESTNQKDCGSSDKPILNASIRDVFSGLGSGRLITTNYYAKNTQ